MNMNILNIRLNTILFLLLFYSGTAWCTDYISVASGTWSVTTTWSPAGNPTVGDNVTIAAPHTVTINSGAITTSCENLTINSGGTLTQNGQTRVRGTLTILAPSGRLTSGVYNLAFSGNVINNGILEGTATTYFDINAKTISGSGSFPQTSAWFFRVNTTIAAGTSISKSSSNFSVSNGVTVTNNGTVYLPHGTIQFGTLPTSTWINASGSSLTVGAAMTGSGTLTASANPNTVSFLGISSLYTIFPLSLNAGTFHHLIIRKGGALGSATRTISKNIIVNGDLTIGYTGYTNTFDVNGQNVTIKGNLITAGTAPLITNNTGTMTFDGTSAQTISGTIANITSTTLIINNAAGVTSSNSMTINGTITVSSGTFATGANTITLPSTAGSTARIGNSAGSITGTNWIIQRFVAAGDTGWQDMSSPIAAANISAWDDSLTLSIDPSCPDGMAAGWSSVYYFNEATQTWIAVASCVEPLTPTKGFELWLATTLSVFTGKTFRTVGTPNIGTMAATVASGLDNYSLVGNPYASGMNWSLIADGGDAPNLYDYYEIYDDLNHNYAAWDGFTNIGTGKLAGTGGIIPAHQGFWVSCNGGGAASLTFRESQKSATNIELVKMMSPVETNILRMKIHSDKMPNAHESIIRFTENATENRDAHGDIPFRKSREVASPSITPVSADNYKLSISSFPDNKETLDIPITATVGVPGDYMIDFKNVNSVLAYSCLVVEDVSTGNQFPLKRDYTFKFTSHSETDSEWKFILHCKKSSSDCYDSQNSSPDVNISANNNGITASFYFENATTTTISVSNILGQETMNTTISVSQDDLILPLPKTNSVYFIRITTEEGTVTKKIIY